MEKSPLAFMPKWSWPCSCGTQDAFHASLQPRRSGTGSAFSTERGNTYFSACDENGHAIPCRHIHARALELEEIPCIVNDFRQAVGNARDAGF